MNIIVTVNKPDIRTDSCVQSGISCIRPTAIGFMDYPDSLIFFRPLVTNCSALIRGSVINQYDFKVFISLFNNTPDTFVKILFNIPCVSE